MKNETKELIAKGAVKFEKSAPDKTIQQELYGALKKILDQIPEKPKLPLTHIIKEIAQSAIEKYEQILNSK